MKKNSLCNLIVFLLSVVSVLLSACTNSKKLTYFTNINRDSTVLLQAQNLQTIIAKGDILQISISTLDEATTRTLNAVTTNSGSGPNGTIVGYTVDEAGLIKLPLLGAIKAEGYTKGQLEAFIVNALLEKKLAKDPVVVVRIANYRIVVWGEVARPGVIAVPNERITLPEALGQAGDLTQFGRRDSILLIREVNGKRIFKRFSLNKGEIFDPEIYHLRNQDIIYVSPSNERTQAQDRSFQYVSLGLSAVSLLVIIYVQLVK